MITEAHIVTDNLDELLSVLPSGLAENIGAENRALLLEVVLDLGRKPEARFSDRFAYLREEPVTREELDFVESMVGTFGDDNRAGIPATLHRISAMRNRRGVIVGLTLRVGRAVTGIVDILRDIIESGESLLLMGRPGLGKTTLLREMARVLADELGKRVVIVDTSNEIAGDGDVPHPAIGRARRMQVPHVAQQHDVMIEAVENHMPEVIVIDEIGHSAEAMAARTIAERGVQLVATVHGNTLDNLLANPTMSDLVGGIQAVTLSDEEARRRGTQKTVLERKSPPTFDVVVEMIERDKIAVRRPVAEVVDALLRGMDVPPELRWRDDEGEVHLERPRWNPEDSPAHTRHAFDNRGPGGARGRGGRIKGRGGREVHPPRGVNGGLDPNGSRFGRDRHAERYANGTRGASVSDLLEEDEYLDSETDIDVESDTEQDESTLAVIDMVNVPSDMSKLRRFYPFGVSRSRLTRAIKHLGLPITVARHWQDADAVLMLTGSEGLSPSSTLLREARELNLPIIGVKGNTYGQIMGRLNELFGDADSGPMTAREAVMKEARDAAQRVLSSAEPVELRPQNKTLRRVQHQLATRYHLRSYSVGREPNRRVRFLPNLTR